MAEKSCVKGVSYRLRANTPQPQRGCPSYDPTNSFVLQTFGAEKRTTWNYKATAELIESNDLIGLNPNARFDSASYQGTQYVSKDGEILFTGQEQELEEYIDESQMPGVTSFEFE